MSGRKIRRRLRQEANERGFTVKGLNGDVRPGVIIGGGPHRALSRLSATVCVQDEFGPITFSVGWSLVRAIAEGYLTQIDYRKRMGHLKHLW